jgi:ribokinase
MTIHVIGNVARDTILRVDRFPMPGETIVARDVRDDFGGKGANQAIMLARCGVPVRLTVAVGDDDVALALRRHLEREGIDTSFVVRPGPSDRSLILVDAAGDNMIVSMIGAAGAVTPADLVGAVDAMQAGDTVLMQGNLSADTTAWCLEAARMRGCTTVLNPSPIRFDYRDIWALADVAVVNRGEAVELGGAGSPEDAAASLLRKGVGLVALTRGAEGARILARDHRLAQPAEPVAAVDSAGAGDVFCGVLLAARAKSRDWPEALRLAVIASGRAVARRGTVAAFPGAEECRLLFASSPRELAS